VMNQQRKSIYALRRQVLSGQYRQEATAEEQKRGIVPSPLVTESDERYVELLGSGLENLVRMAGASAPPQGATQEEQEAHRRAVLATKLEDIKQLGFAQLEQVIYVNFGCRTDLRAYQADAVGCVAHLKQVVPLSLTEQKERLLDLIDEVIGTSVEHACPPNKHFEDWDSDGLKRAYQENFGIEATGAESMTDAQEIAVKLFGDARAVLDKREREVGELLYLRVFRNFFLQEIDNQWLEHLQAMEGLRDGIGLRGYGQRDPKKEYQKEGFNYFLELMQTTKSSVVQKMFHFVIEREDEVERLEAERRRRVEQRQARMNASHVAAPAAAAAIAEGGDDEGEEAAPDESGPRQPVEASRAARRRIAATGQNAGDAPAPKAQTVKRDKPKVGRNDPCWCGSGKKYKSCHLRSDEDQQTGT